MLIQPYTPQTKIFKTAHAKINSKWIKDLNIRTTTIKFLEENKVEQLHDVGFGSEFLAMTPKAQASSEEIDKLDFIKIKNFCTLKDSINRVKGQNPEREKMFANHISRDIARNIQSIIENYNSKNSKKQIALLENEQRI